MGFKHCRRRKAVQGFRLWARFAMGGLFVSAALFPAAPAIAGDWRIVSWNDEFVLYLDYATIRRVGPVTAYQSKVMYIKDPNLAELQSTVEMHCNRKQYRNLRVSAISRVGGIESVAAVKEWRKLEPGTNVEREFLIVCTG